MGKIIHFNDDARRRLQRGVDICPESGHRIDERERGAHRLFYIVLLRAGIAEIGEYSVADKPGDNAVISGNDPRASGPIGTDHLPHVLGIEARRKRSRAYQIAEHNGEVASLSIASVSGLGDQFGLIEFGDHAQHFTTMAEQDPEPIEVLVR